MKRNAAAVALVAALGGCMSVDQDAGMPHGTPGSGGCPGYYGAVQQPPMVPGVQTAWGQPVPMAQPYAMSPPHSNYQAYQMMAQSLPMDLVQRSNPALRQAADSGIRQVSVEMPAGSCPPGGCVPAMSMPPGGLLAPPGAPFAPGMAAPEMTAPGVGTPPPGFTPPPGAVAAVNPAGGSGPAPFPIKRTQVRFVRPSGMKVAWLAPGPDGRPAYTPTVLEAPGRYNFLQAAIYRLKLSNIEGRPGLELYPTLEVVPCNSKTDAFLSHSAVPIDFTNEDFDQIAAGNYVVKVIYLPDPQYQEVAATGIEEISSTRLEPGADPIVEACRRGSILLVIRMGNMDQEAPNTPAIDAPGNGAGAAPPPPGCLPGMGMPGPAPMVPYGMGAPFDPMLPPGAPMPGLMGPPPSIPPGLRMGHTETAPSPAPAAPEPGAVSSATPSWHPAPVTKLPDTVPVQQATAVAPASPGPTLLPPVPTPAELAAQFHGTSQP
jgi:hypothetical protein